MTDPHDHHAVAREDLEFDVKMALRKAGCFWPKRRGPGDQDDARIGLIAAAVVDHVAPCGIRCIRKGPAPLHGTLAPRPSPRQDGAADEWDAGCAFAE